jgi:hypothetical protein
MKLSWSYIVALILALIGFIVMLITIYLIKLQNFDINIIGQYGSFSSGFIGSLFSLAGFLLLFETLIQQQKLFNKQQFESKFFDLLKLSRENMVQLKKRLPIKGDKYEEGRRVFVELRKEFGEIYHIVKRINSTLESKIEEKDMVNISYLTLNYGVSETIFGEGQNPTSMLLNRLKYFSYDNVLCNKLVEECRKCMDEEGKYMKFNGNLSRLSHYFRHLFQTIKFVDNSKFLTEKEKYFYIKTLRAQLSTHEQLILFYNSLSILGNNWTKNPDLISKYKLIKNIPLENGFTYGINPKKYFQMDYEFEES